MRLFLPAFTLFFRSVITKPSLWLIIDIQAMPTKIVLWQVYLLFCGGQDVAIDDAVQLTVGKMFRKVEHDPLRIELLNRIMQNVMNLFIA